MSRKNTEKVTNRGFYPVVATIKYKDRNINIQIPVRQKIIGLVKYHCPKCEKEGTKTDVIHIARDMHHRQMRNRSASYIKETWPTQFNPHEFDKVPELEWAYNRKSRDGIPTNLIDEELGDIHCPNCYFFNDGEKVLMKPNTTKLIKTYVSKIGSEFIKFDELVDPFLGWGERRGDPWKKGSHIFGRNQKSTYDPCDEEGLKAGHKRIAEWTEKDHELKRGTSIEIDLSPTTMGVLEEEYKRAEMRRTAKGI
jgi:DNA-directed RNA polymerase subunit RPC12/RpoP